MLRKLAFSLLAVFLLSWSSNLRADEVLLEQLYGGGVHAYNEGDYLGAYDSLSSAIKGGTNDPRAYYFRGLTYLKLGRAQEAQADFQAGAEMEVGDSAEVYPVNRSLERIQGRSRQMLEQYRTNVHAAAVQRKERERQARYEEHASAEQEVLRRVTPPPMPSNAAGQSAPHTENGTGAPGGPAKANNLIDKPSAEPDKNPFETEPAKPATKAPEENGGNPFGGSEPEPKKSTGSTPAANDNPFGTFGNSQSPAPPEKPAGTVVPPQKEQSPTGTVQPTPGGLSSLARAIAKGAKSDQANSPPAAGSSLPNILQGLFGHGTAPPAGAPPMNSTPTPGGNGPPPPNINPAGATPAPPTATPQPGPPSAGPPMPAGGAQPATQPTPPAGTPPQQNTPTPPPKDDNNPFN
ncbi:MAG TPA: hypothetical protein VFE46_08460 [Pirellulales bacterium]|jgi:hypothetical protein|nr:hypothetical protein [Pirellulales bacterium]